MITLPNWMPVMEPSQKKVGSPPLLRAASGSSLVPDGADQDKALLFIFWWRPLPRTHRGAIRTFQRECGQSVKTEGGGIYRIGKTMDSIIVIQRGLVEAIANNGDVRLEVH